MNNAQTFSQSSGQYAKHRPRYPEELFAYLNEICTGHDLAWDCATGTGQAAVSLSNYFKKVEATDISKEQIKNAIGNPKVSYSVSPAEQTSFGSESFDVVTVATAIHWFDQQKFFEEVNRVLKPAGVFAIWAYGFFEIEPEIDKIIFEELLKPIDIFWAEGNRQVMNGYKDLVMPFVEIHTNPSFNIHLEWDRNQLLAYLGTWSAVKRYLAEVGTNPLERLEEKLNSVWGEASLIKPVRMPIAFRASRKT